MRRREPREQWCLWGLTSELRLKGWGVSKGKAQGLVWHERGQEQEETGPGHTASRALVGAF